jgi:hypothetical protein
LKGVAVGLGVVGDVDLSVLRLQPPADYTQADGNPFQLIETVADDP